jgi:type VI secretion system secreted protein VgrG
VIFDWQIDRVMRPGKVVLRDHNFQLPKESLEVTTSTNGKCSVGGNSQLEVFDYAGEYAERFNKPDERLDKVLKEGERLAKARMEEAETAHLEITATSDCRSVTPGYKFDMIEHFDEGLNGTYLVVSSKHSIRQTPDYTGTENEISEPYSNSFVCIPDGVPFRPPRRTPKPVVEGLQSAVVVGPSGEEIFTDKYGRVKVQFHWDRRGKKDENSSCWMRVSQPQAGKRWGTSFTPRIGQEVLVAFIEGDPDQPIIMGSVYNADQMPPYEGGGPDGKHPSNNAISGIKSCSTPGGDGFNEIRFNDQKGKEQFYIHGQKDLDIRIEENSRSYIGLSQHLNVKEHRKSLIEGDDHEKIDGDQVEQVGGNHLRQIGGDTVFQVGGAANMTIASDRTESVGASESLTVGANQSISVGANQALEAGGSIHIKAGMTCVIEAGAALTLQVGGSFITLSSLGVAIQGTAVLINSGGAAVAGAGASTSDPEKPEDPEAPDEAEKDAKTGSISCS